ncbi:hypothetical protein DMC30DRAFT_136322 [Rhodotorula diobovata]|uniref:Uncharacterized protein n=1 Tax=Rhodotorula diobovata TaxID=5288 RepID=A0A5C5G243_9BASI|nr:hypothetical protein DMC30DRAFT_136322 [Rhodotorula diobovata]
MTATAGSRSTLTSWRERRAAELSQSAKVTGWRLERTSERSKVRLSPFDDRKDGLLVTDLEVERLTADASSSEESSTGGCGFIKTCSPLRRMSSSPPLASTRRKSTGRPTRGRQPGSAVGAGLAEAAQHGVGLDEGPSAVADCVLAVRGRESLVDDGEELGKARHDVGCWSRCLLSGQAERVSSELGRVCKQPLERVEGRVEARATELPPGPLKR